MNSQLSPKAKMGLVMIALLIAIQYVLLPFFAWQQELLDKRAMLQKQLTKMVALQNQEQALTKAVAQLQTELAAVKQRYFQQVSPRSLQLKAQQQLDLLANQHQVLIDNISWQPNTAGEDPIKGPLKIKMKGPFERLAKFLLALEKGRYFFEIFDIRLNLQRKPGEVQLDATLISYGQVENSSSGKRQ